MNKALISCGSNIDPYENMEKARKLISERFHVLGHTPLEITKPVGFVDQPDFVNAAIQVETDLGIESLTRVLHGFEEELGRVRTENRFGPRTIDLDVLVYGGELVDWDVYTRGFLKRQVKAFYPDLI